MTNKIRCADCKYCKSLRPTGNTRSNFYCEHPNHEYIRKYYAEHRIYRLQGFIGFGARYSEEVPVKTSPAWCPKKAEGRNEQNGIRETEAFTEVLYERQERKR